MLTACFIGGPAIYLMNVMATEWHIWALLIVIGMIMYLRMPVAEAYIIGQASTRNRSSIMGIFYFGSMESGSVLTLGMGYLIDHIGFNASLSIAGAAIFFITLICSLWLWRIHD